MIARDIQLKRGGNKMYYKYGDICINKQKLNNFLKQLTDGEYTTFDILKEYQGEVKVNKGISVGESWNANFARILSQCANETDGIIINIAKNTSTTVDGNKTTTAEWKLL